MALEGSYTFAGIGAAEAKSREDEYRSGVPAAGAGLTALLSAPSLRTTGIRVMNQGEADALIALAHGSKEKAVTAERLTASRISSTVYRGKLQFGNIKPESVTIAVTAGPGPLTDPDGDGKLLDAALVERGTINYRTGAFSLTFASAVTEPVTAAYTHTDFTQFASPSQSQTQAAGGAYPETITTGFGRVVPGSIAVTDGTRTFVDDGKGKMIETTAGASVVTGTVDYALGIIILTSGSAPLAGTVTTTYTFNPFAVLLVKGGGSHGASLLSDTIPELGSEAYADGLKGETRVCLLGVSRDVSKSTNVVAWFAHHVEDSYRVEQENSNFPPGGASNDPRVNTISN